MASVGRGAYFVWCPSVAGVALVLACGSERESDHASEAASPAYQVRDSAGVAVIEHPDFDSADSVSWSVDPHPSAVIGKTDGDDPYLFSEVAGALRQDNGTIVVADRRSRQLRFFDSTGTFVKAIGGPGQGPGELGEGVDFHPVLYGGAGDSLLVRDSFTRLNLFDAVGEFVRRIRIAATDSIADAVGDRARLSLIFDDGSFLVHDQTDVCAAIRGPAGPCEITMIFRRIRENGSVVAVFGKFPVARMYIAKSRGMERSITEHEAPPFWGVHGTRLYYGDSRSFEYRVFGGDGRLERIVRVAMTPTPGKQLRPPSWVTARMQPLKSPGGPSPALVDQFEEEAWRAVPRPSRLRAYDGLVVDRLGNAWLKEYSVADDSASSGDRWWVFDSLGTLRHSVRLPAAIGQVLRTKAMDLWPQPIFIDGKVILASSRNEDGVPVLHVYRLVKMDQSRQ